MQNKNIFSLYIFVKHYENVILLCIVTQQNYIFVGLELKKKKCTSTSKVKKDVRVWRKNGEREEGSESGWRVEEGKIERKGGGNASKGR